MALRAALLTCLPNTHQLRVTARHRKASLSDHFRM